MAVVGMKHRHDVDTDDSFILPVSVTAATLLA
jgi:hypothetical protein